MGRDSKDGTGGLAEGTTGHPTGTSLADGNLANLETAFNMGKAHRQDKERRIARCRTYRKSGKDTTA